MCEKDYHSEWNEFINLWLDDKITNDQFLDFFNLIYMFRNAFEAYQNLDKDVKEALAEFLGIV